jgi:hypothetical protein
MLARLAGEGNRLLRDSYISVSNGAYALARLVHWEGDIREGPFVSMLPFPGNNWSAPIIAWKQDNNGTTFIASPVSLPWVEAVCESWIAMDDDGKLFGPEPF